MIEQYAREWWKNHFLPSTSAADRFRYKLFYDALLCFIQPQSNGVWAWAVTEQCRHMKQSSTLRTLLPRDESSLSWSHSYRTRSPTSNLDLMVPSIATIMTRWRSTIILLKFAIVAELFRSASTVHVLLYFFFVIVILHTLIVWLLCVFLKVSLMRYSLLIKGYADIIVNKCK